MVKTVHFEINGRSVGALLRHRREELNISQRQVANLMGYRNINFISMIEHGRSNPPLGRLTDICKVYQLPLDFLSVMVKGIYPDCWNILFAILDEDGHFKDMGRKEAEGALDKRFNDMMHDYGIRQEELLGDGF